MTTGPAAALPAAEIARLIDEAIKSGKGLEEEVLNKIANELTRLFSVKPDEVAILELAPNGAILNFLYPSKLRKVGSIPMSTTNSLAVRTVREKRPEMINNFPAQKHPTVFESVALDESKKERNPIQKIMSVPLLVDGKAVGAVQVSRKGKSPTTAGSDFTIRDLTTLVTTASVLAKCFKK
ncbi:MAG: GAF domain-containing protein [Acidobacteria bacterium]|nr:GAF domain-containing protein [Acidobacteriota bacterium]